jgi:hypothetical protein
MLINTVYQQYIFMPVIGRKNTVYTEKLYCLSVENIRFILRNYTVYQ